MYSISNINIDQTYDRAICLHCGCWTLRDICQPQLIYHQRTKN